MVLDTENYQTTFVKDENWKKKKVIRSYGILTKSVP